MGEALMVGMSEIKTTRCAGDVLIALGLGSCIGVCAYDPYARVAGLAHIVLPDSVGHEANPGKFADTGIPLLLEEMSRLGAVRSRLRVALAGGAQLFAFQGAGPRLEIGARNTVAVHAVLQQHAIPILAEEVGGTSGRTVHFYANGLVRVKKIGQEEHDLIALGHPIRREPSPSAPPRLRMPVEKFTVRSCLTVPVLLPTCPGLDALGGWQGG